MPRTSYFKMGDWNAICDGCGHTFKASQLQKDWRGFMMCVRDWEPRHPQDFVRGVPEEAPLPWVRPQLAPIFVDASVVNPGPIGPPPAPPPPAPPPPPPAPAPAPLFTVSIAGEGLSGDAVAGDFGTHTMAGQAIGGDSLAG